jgi:hypothetical protein
MARKRHVPLLAVGLLGVGLVGCGGGQPGVEEVTGNALSANALSANALSANALSANALSANALSANALSANALSANALTSQALEDPLAREFLSYVVSCALPAEAVVDMTIDGTEYKFPGGLGLAPEWGETGGHCDETCQRWVTACVLARVDFLGVHRIISVRGASPALRTTWQERRDYQDDEAAYFGNLFIPGAPKFACLGPGKKAIPRVCGDSLDTCPMQVVGSCAKACGFQGPAGGFVDCSSSGNERKPEIYLESVTVFLPKSGM